MMDLAVFGIICLLAVFAVVWDGIQQRKMRQIDREIQQELKKFIKEMNDEHKRGG